MAFYKRHLPHWQPEGAEFFVTFRLAGSLPKGAINRLKALQKKFRDSDESDIKSKIRSKVFRKYEYLLDTAATGFQWLKEDNIAHIVQVALHFYDEKEYDLYAYSVMPNHVHMVFRLLIFEKEAKDLAEDYSVAKIMHSIKSYTALECNKVLDRTGAFWQSESYDRVIRNQQELERTIRYTLNNPVKAGLVDDWQNWPYTYCKPKFIATFKTT